jgi:hypothetical protein
MESTIGKAEGRGERGVVVGLNKVHQVRTYLFAVVGLESSFKKLVGLRNKAANTQKDI